MEKSSICTHCDRLKLGPGGFSPRRTHTHTHISYWERRRSAARSSLLFVNTSARCTSAAEKPMAYTHTQTQTYTDTDTHTYTDSRTANIGFHSNPPAHPTHPTTKMECLTNPEHSLGHTHSNTLAHTRGLLTVRRSTASGLGGVGATGRGTLVTGTAPGRKAGMPPSGGPTGTPPAPAPSDDRSAACS